MSTSSITPSPPLSLSHAHIIPLEGSPPDKKQDKGKAPASPTTLGDGEDTAIDDESEIEEEELPICSVCLEPFQTRTSVSPCFHSFCFHCICQWAELSRKCPTCRQKFTFAVVHGRGEDDHEKHEFSELPEKDAPFIFSRPPRLLSNRHRQAHGSTSRTARQWGRRDPSGRESPDIMRKDEAEVKRRYIYKHGLRAKHVGVNGKSKCKEVTPDEFKRNPSLLRKLEPWIRRDLQAILKTDDVEIVKAIVIALLTREDPRTDTAIDFLKDYLHEYNEHFIHELICFAKSPLNMQVYDTVVQYDDPQRGLRRGSRSEVQSMVDEGPTQSAHEEEKERKRRRSPTEKASTRSGKRSQKRSKRSKAERKSSGSRSRELETANGSASGPGYDEYGNEVNFDASDDEGSHLASVSSIAKQEQAVLSKKKGVIDENLLKEKLQKAKAAQPRVGGGGEIEAKGQVNVELIKARLKAVQAGVRRGNEGQELLNVELIKRRLQAMKDSVNQA